MDITTGSRKQGIGICHGTKCPTQKLSGRPIMAATSIWLPYLVLPDIMWLPYLVPDQMWQRYLVRDLMLQPYTISYITSTIAKSETCMITCMQNKSVSALCSMHVNGFKTQTHCWEAEDIDTHKPYSSMHAQ